MIHKYALVEVATALFAMKRRQEFLMIMRIHQLLDQKQVTDHHQLCVGQQCKKQNSLLVCDTESVHSTMARHYSP